MDLTHFTGLFIDGSVPIDFTECLDIIDKSLAAKVPDRLARRRGPVRTTPEFVIRICISNTVASKVNRRSCSETKSNALKVLAKIGRQILNACEGPYARDIEGNKLDELLTNTMCEIWKLMTPDDFSYRLVSKKDFTDEIVEVYTLGLLKPKPVHLGLEKVLNGMEIVFTHTQTVSAETKARV